VGNANNVGVSEGGNQTIVEVGIGVCVAVSIGVSVGRDELKGRQATRSNVVARRPKADEAIPARRCRLLRRFTPRADNLRTRLI
jgi:hypothetical protein